MPKLIACIDFFNHGHRLHLMRSIIKTIIDAGHNAICITDNTTEIKTWIDEYSPNENQQVTYHDHKCTEPSRLKWNKDLNDILIALHYWRQYNLVLKKIEKENSLTVDIVVINYIDVFLSCLMPHFLQNLFFDYRWAGLYVHTRYMRMFEHLGVQHKKTKISDIDYLFKSEKCIGIGVFDNGINQALEFRLDKKVTLIPDITDVSTDNKVYPLANEIIKQANGRMVVGTIGMNFYGGFVDMVKLAMYCHEKHPEFYFVCCGQFEENIYAEITNKTDAALVRNFRQHPSDNCYWKEGYLADEPTYNAVFNSFDIIHLIYKNFYSSSNRLTKAANFHKFVLANNIGCVGDDVPKYDLGETADENNINEHQQKIEILRERILKKDFPYQQWKIYSEKHSTEILKEKFTELLKLV